MSIKRGPWQLMCPTSLWIECHIWIPSQSWDFVCSLVRAFRTKMRSSLVTFNAFLTTSVGCKVANYHFYRKAVSIYEFVGHSTACAPSHDFLKKPALFLYRSLPLNFKAKNLLAVLGTITQSIAWHNPQWSCNPFLMCDLSFAFSSISWQITDT